MIFYARRLAIHVFICLIILLFSIGSRVSAEDGSGADAVGVEEAAHSKIDIPENYNCVNCHTDMEDETLTPPVNEWKESVHAEVGIKCHDCHGGDPVDEDMAMDPDIGFIGKPAVADIPALCAKCHSDSKMMRAYNQRADQFDLYSGSVHGRKVKGGDEEAPTCVSCHGKHKILRVKDPNSAVFRTNIPNMCGECHSQEAIFKKRRKPFDQLALYQESKHYKLVSEGDALAPTCVDCHGNHGIVPPSSDRVQTVCFKCHSSQAEYYKESPHWAVYKKEGEPVCLHCHNNHDVEHPTVDKFTGDNDNDCIGCHDSSEPAYQLGVEMQSAMRSTVDAVTKASTDLSNFEENAHGGFEVTELLANMEKTEEGLKELTALTHKLDVEAVKKQTEGLIVSANEVEKEVASMWSEIKTRKVGLFLAWIVFLGFAGSLWFKSKQYEHRD